ncbi:MAG: hypothetical protein Q8M31_05395 [Beijerinckiaceae bacterium]|nr:hypothetical protein [Beijerinckiaceae bacterium]
MALAQLCDATATEAERGRAQRALIKLTQVSVRWAPTRITHVPYQPHHRTALVGVRAA